ncbi:MAG: prepilin-type N-terminal cleavage/methylation domain-containing protein [Phormidesmis sp.]
MALPNLKLRLRQLWFKSSRFNLSGFTLLELLISVVIAGIVVSGLLYLVVELLQIDRRESVLDQTQRDMQRALNYMADDLREAVYIYDDPSTVAAQLSDLPAGGIPVLAFWRPDPIDTNLPACAGFSGSTQDECNVLAIRQSAYSLVVYLQKAKDTNTNWSGESRIIRYELDKYSNLSTLANTTGYRDPASDTVDFSNWTRLGNTTDGTKAVLVDFVDNPSTPYTKSPLSDSTTGNVPAPCSSLGATYKVIPSTATTSTSTSFFGCIRDPNPTIAGTEGNANQDAYLFLRGSIEGAGGSIVSFSEDSSLPVLETRVLMRGVIDKNPVD